MSIHKDRHGLAPTAASKQAVRHYDSAVTAYLRFDRDTGAHLKATLQADPAFLMAHRAKGYFFRLFCNRALQARAQAELDAAQAAAQKHVANAREQAHMAALAASAGVTRNATCLSKTWCRQRSRPGATRWRARYCPNGRRADPPAFGAGGATPRHWRRWLIATARAAQTIAARLLAAWRARIRPTGVDPRVIDAGRKQGAGMDYCILDEISTRYPPFSSEAEYD